MRRRVNQVTQLVVVAATLSLLWPTPAHAQRHGHGHPHGGVVVHAAYGGPYFYPGFYYPGFYYSALCSAFAFGWYGYPWGAVGTVAGLLGTTTRRAPHASRAPPPQAEVYVDGYYAGHRRRLRRHVSAAARPARRARGRDLSRGLSIDETEHPVPAAGGLQDQRPAREAGGRRAGGAPAQAVAEHQPGAHPGGARPGRGGHDDERGAQRRGAPAEASGFGTLAVRVQPAGASILVDGERWEGSDTSGERLLVQLAEGRHRVEVQRDGYQSYATDIEVRSGETATLNVSLPAGAAMRTRDKRTEQRSGAVVAVMLQRAGRCGPKALRRRKARPRRNRPRRGRPCR